mgnify:CR=1 FL=1
MFDLDNQNAVLRRPCRAFYRVEFLEGVSADCTVGQLQRSIALGKSLVSSNLVIESTIALFLQSRTREGDS